MHSFSVINRLAAAVFFYVLVFSALGALHDYPQLRKYMHGVLQKDTRLQQRQWLGVFYLVNEAGSGIKFLLTGNERYMAHYPSASHLLAARRARADSGNDWQLQLTVANMYYLGNGSAPDHAESLYWLQRAKENAPDQRSAAQIDAIIKRVKQETEAR